MLRIVDMKTARLIRAHGIVDPQPELTWGLETDRNGEAQTACEIEVDRLAADGQCLAAWRSGKMDRSIGEIVCYEGEPLETRSDYRWRVRVWDRDDQTGDWSDWAEFETGVIVPDKIAARWVAGGGALRRVFNVRNGLLRARAYVSGLGYYECHCNGRNVSAAALAPSFTEFDRRVEYEVVDLGPALAMGDNCVGFLLGDGWWRHTSHSTKNYDRHVNQALAEIVLEYADGSRDVVRTDETWQVEQGPLIAGENTSPAQIFDGVSLDLGWLASGWSTPGFDASGWASAHVAGNGVGPLYPCLLPPIRQVQTLAPASVTRRADNALVVDFGQNFSGWVAFRATGSKGTRLVVRHAELLHPDGRLNPATLRAAKAVDSFLLSGEPGEEVRPRFLYHGLRYAEIEGPVEVVDVASIAGAVVHTDLEAVGSVVTSDARVNWLLDAVRWTVRSNAMSVMTDNCQRDERRGWLMDGGNAFRAGALFYDMVPMARKWIEDMIDNQEPEGCLRGDVAPFLYPARSLGWQRALALVPMAAYDFGGDQRLLRRAFPHMRRYADFLIDHLKDDLLPPRFSTHSAEWLCIGKRNDQVSDNAIAVDVLRNVARAAEILGESGGARHAEAADRIAAAAHRRWCVGKDGCFGGDGGEGYAQSNLVYGLQFGLVGAEEQSRVFESLVFDMMEARGRGPFVTTGIGSTEYVPFVLDAFGRGDLLWQWLQRDDYPGFGFMQRHGATAIWECWEQRVDNGMNSHNHAGFCGIGTWLMQGLVGIRVEPGPQPRFHLRPACHLPLAALDARWKSLWGELRVQWETREGGEMVVTVMIPPGCRAVLMLPGSGKTIMLDSGCHAVDVGGGEMA